MPISLSGRGRQSRQSRSRNTMPWSSKYRPFLCLPVDQAASVRTLNRPPTLLPLPPTPTSRHQAHRSLNKVPPGRIGLRVVLIGSISISTEAGSRAWSFLSLVYSPRTLQKQHLVIKTLVLANIHTRLFRCFASFPANLSLFIS